MKRYRVHITCPAGHKTYWDYARRIDASRASFRESDLNGWYCSHIEKLTGGI